MLFSVIIPTFNRAILLREALDSVFAQTFTDYEVIVVDDGSEDETSAMVANYGDCIRFFRQENRGPGAARNLGIQNATGAYVAFLDSDDVWFPWTLASYHETIQRCGRPSFIAGNCLKFAQFDELKAVHLSEIDCELFADYYTAWRRNLWIGTCGVAIKRKEILRCGGYLQGMVNAEDSDMWMKLGIMSGFAHLTSPVVFGFRETPASVSKTGTRTAAGIRQMVASEKAGAYPGGNGRRRERWQILTRHVRPASLGCLKESNWRDAWWLYRQSFWWHVRLGRIRYLVAMPFLYILHRLKAVLRCNSG